MAKKCTVESGHQKFFEGKAFFNGKKPLEKIPLPSPTML